MTKTQKERERRIKKRCRKEEVEREKNVRE
jgi:hypothetical protein